jgi:hypothetical protein
MPWRLVALNPDFGAAARGVQQVVSTCQGNYGLMDILRGARFEEKEAAQGAASDPRQ